MARQTKAPGGPFKGGAFHGLFSGKVIDNEDPAGKGRCIVSCPAVFGSIPEKSLPWATPRFLSWVSSGKTKTGGVVAVPPKGAPVHVEFLDGNPLYPVYSGCGFTDASGPVPLPKGSTKGVKPGRYSFTTPKGASVMLDDRDGNEKILIQTGKGDYIAVTDVGLTEIRPSKQLNVKCPGLIEIQSSRRVEIKAPSIGLYGKTNLDLVSDGSICLNAAGVVAVDGSNVHLNSGMSMGLMSAKDLPMLKVIDTAKTQDSVV